MAAEPDVLMWPGQRDERPAPSQARRFAGWVIALSLAAAAVALAIVLL